MVNLPMRNIQFNYLYRDAGNYKNYGFVVFADDGHLNLDELTAFIREKLIDGTWFYAEDWKLPCLYFSPNNPELDHTFHEFESISFTTQSPNIHQNLSAFIAPLLKHS